MRNILNLAGRISLLLLIVTGCTTQPKVELTQSGLDPMKFADTIDGKPTALYVLKNQNGMEVCITNFGGRIVSVMVPDKDGNMKDVVLGFDSIGKYVNIPSDFGATIGRYANRIKQGQITIDGETIELPQNNFGHTLHGGPNGWQYKIFDVAQSDETSLKLTLNSPDGDENFPGNVEASVTFTLTEDNAIDISYEATTDKKTVINMTNHSYFNLAGNPKKEITEDILYINADEFTPVDSTFMTTGEIVSVEGTPFDFRTPKVIGEEIDADDIQIENGNGYDHNWVLNTKGDIQQLAVRLSNPSSGITLEVYTDEPGIQVYTGNFLDASARGKENILYDQRAAICLETQHYPDSPNKPQWPSVILEPGQTYTSRCIYKFGVQQ